MSSEVFKALKEKFLAGGFTQTLVGNDPTLAYVFETESIDVKLREGCPCVQTLIGRKKRHLCTCQEGTGIKNLSFRCATRQVGKLPQTVVEEVSLEAIEEAISEINKLSSQRLDSIELTKWCNASKQSQMPFLRSMAFPSLQHLASPSFEACRQKMAQLS